MNSRSMMVVLTVVLFLGMFMVFSSSGECETENGNTLYVGRTGSGKYSSIQAAINDAGSGDIIVVYNGTYQENLVLNKSIILIGMDRYNTIIDGNSSGDVVVISADNVCICNFTIENSGSGSSCAGMNIQADHCIIKDNIIIDNGWSGIKTGKSCKNCTVRSNIIRDNGYGIFFNEGTLSVTFSGNIISNNSWDGIYLGYSTDSIIAGNIIEGNGDDGIGLSFDSNIVIDGNVITRSGDNGLYLYSSKTTINENTITDNVEGGIFLRNSNDSDIGWNTLGGNKKGVGVTFFSSDNKIHDNNITGNVVGIHVSSDAGVNSFSDNIFYDNNENIVQEESKTPGFEIILVVFSVAFVLFWKRYCRRI